MKKKVTIIFLCAILFLTGCTKAHETMSISLDKKMKLELLFAAQTNNAFVNKITEENQTKLAERGFVLTDYTGENESGIVLTKKFNSIDALSTEKPNITSIANIIIDETPIVFTMKKGFFKNTYSVSISKSTIQEQAEAFKNVINMDLATMMKGKEVDAKFVLNLPYKAKNQNATLVENNEKKLTWDLTSSGNNIMATFEIYNLLNVGIILGSILAMIIITSYTLYTRATNRRLLAEYRTRKAISPQQYTYEAARKRERERLYGEEPAPVEEKKEETPKEEEKEVELISFDSMPDDLAPLDENKKEE